MIINNIDDNISNNSVMKKNTNKHNINDTILLLLSVLLLLLSFPGLNPGQELGDMLEDGRATAGRAIAKGAPKESQGLRRVWGLEYRALGLGFRV